MTQPLQGEQLLAAKRKLCFRIAEDLPLAFKNLHGYDVDKAAKWLYTLLPDTYAEAEAEFDAINADTERATPFPTRPSMMALLREALHFSESAPLSEVIALATARVKQRDELLAACEAFAFGDEAIEGILFGDAPDDASVQLTLPMGDLRRARAAIGKAKGTP